ncbi:glycosyltransferase family 2 protein [Mycolicibacterium sp. P1-18]|uniref:glycosyltransferase family A protein n=1 Tax=Mycolicibacterium sp. P1-18 TaxID=2024615 RepID=UPI0011F31F5A|nr:glycosyltransferase family A protein [Mycolicibacterium sp. P1-18]KAA0098835.1 glycosyltransferase family 2 protein [Mycolicibacterium sp. P1-18]
MITFITSLRHPQNSADYGRVESLLADTLASIARQTSDDFAVLVVGNRRPAFDLPRQTHFVEVDFDPPTTHAGAQTGMSAVIWDKGTKLGIGLAAARAFDPDYVMFVDADDFVHRDIAAYVHDHAGSPGWVIRRGWMYSRSRNAYALRRRLFRVCGTSFILPFEAYAVPDDLLVTSSQDEVADALGDDALQHVVGEHRYALEWWQKRGRELDTLPFAGAVYHVDTGENHSGSMLLGPGLPHGPQLLDDFGIASSKDRWASRWSAYGPPAFKPDLRPRRPFFLKPATSELPRSRSL